jgi:hypothetical protein
MYDRKRSRFTTEKMAFALIRAEDWAPVPISMAAFGKFLRRYRLAASRRVTSTDLDLSMPGEDTGGAVKLV